MKAGRNLLRFAVVLGIGMLGFSQPGSSGIVCAVGAPNACNVPGDCASYCQGLIGSPSAICNTGHCCVCIMEAD